MTMNGIWLREHASISKYITYSQPLKVWRDIEAKNSILRFNVTASTHCVCHHTFLSVAIKYKYLKESPCLKLLSLKIDFTKKTKKGKLQDL